MHNNQVFSESVTGNDGPRKWRHRRWVEIICICFVFLTIFAVILSPLLKLVIVAPKKPKTTTITTTPPPITTAISKIQLLTTTTPLITTTTTTTQQSVEESSMSVEVNEIINTGQSVYIKSALGNVYLHLCNSDASNGGNITTWELVDQANLKWLINSTDGGYYISTLVDPNFVVHQHGYTYDNGGAVTTWDRRTAPNNASLKVNFERGHDGFYMIRFLHSGKCVHVQGYSTENNSPITQWDALDQTNFKWEFKYA